jgi:hypothetical protein
MGFQRDKLLAAGKGAVHMEADREVEEAEAADKEAEAADKEAGMAEPR